jgi:hypothetical protein
METRVSSMEGESSGTQVPRTLEQGPPMQTRAAPGGHLSGQSTGRMPGGHLQKGKHGTCVPRCHIASGAGGLQIAIGQKTVDIGR